VKVGLAVPGSCSVDRYVSQEDHLGSDCVVKLSKGNDDCIAGCESESFGGLRCDHACACCSTSSELGP